MAFLADTDSAERASFKVKVYSKLALIRIQTLIRVMGGPADLYISFHVASWFKKSLNFESEVKFRKIETQKNLGIDQNLVRKISNRRTSRWRHDDASIFFFYLDSKEKSVPVISGSSNQLRSRALKIRWGRKREKEGERRRKREKVGERGRKKDKNPQL